MADFREARAFIEQAPGKYYDVDRMWKFQCKDLVDAYCNHLWGVDAWKTTIRPGNANVAWTNYNPEYFDRIANIPGDLTNYPQPADIVVTSGDSINEFGHIFVCVKADAYTILALQQNGDGTASTPAEYQILPYEMPGMGYVLGWLRPKLTGSWDGVAAPALPSDTTLNVIDISQHQRGLNPTSVATAQAVFVKATEGVGWQDPEFLNHVAAVRLAGKPLGLYHFARPWASDGNAPGAESKTFLDAVLPILKPGDVVALDWESDDTSDWVWALNWLQQVEEATGRRPLLYSYLNLIQSGQLDKLQAYPLWLAVYPYAGQQAWGPRTAKPDLPGWNVLMWQYTSTGRLGGYGGDLDLNVFYGGVDTWALLGGTSGVPVPAPAPSPLPSVNLCRVTAGDTMTSIAAQFGVSLESLLAANPAIHPDLIYVGQTLYLPGGAKAPATAPATDLQKIRVEAGDTMSSIAAWAGVSLEALLAANPQVTNPDLIEVDQILYRPSTKTVTEVEVEAGDTLYGIGLQWGVPLQRLIAANPGLDPNLIYPGQVLQLA